MTETTWTRKVPLYTLDESLALIMLRHAGAFAKARVWRLIDILVVGWLRFRWIDLGNYTNYKLFVGMVISYNDIAQKMKILSLNQIETIRCLIFDTKSGAVFPCLSFVVDSLSNFYLYMYAH